MCGINGLFRFDGASSELDPGELSRTSAAQANRGPDGSGEWISPDRRLALAHRRLAILDPSPAGAQPMASGDGRLQVVLNGEIYNFRELRAGLEREGVEFRSASDTEVLLALYARLGREMFQKLRGMYALAIWDARERELVLARDPFGIKPLYYALQGGVLRFASQARALLAGGGTDATVDPVGLAGFLLWGSVQEPATLWRAIRLLPAGHFLVARPQGPQAPQPFFSPLTWPLSEETVPEAIEDSIAAHLVSDVPVGIFLSAGMDSSLIAALACRRLSEAPLTVTAAFDGLDGTPLEEHGYAAETAKELGTRHTTVRITPEDFRQHWPRILAAMDQPSIDGANSYLVSWAAHRAGLKVVLSGLGGDELFGSYPTFRSVPSTRRWVRAAKRLKVERWVERAARAMSGRTPKAAGVLRWGESLAGSYMLRRALFLPEDLGALLGESAAREAREAYDPLAECERIARELPSGDSWTAVHWLETNLYMRNQLLRDADWASMAHGVELRVPFVDVALHRRLLAGNFEPARTMSKAILFRQTARELPEALWQRQKTGFYIPVAEWLRESGGLSKAHQRGSASRQIALTVLASFGVDLDGAA